MFKIVIPELVSIETKMKSFSGSYFLRNLNFYQPTATPYKLHFRVLVKNRLEYPPNYEFRNECFLKLQNTWYYKKNIGGLSFQFQYNPQERTFIFNKLYTRIPFRIGGICPPGEHISDMINLDLFLNGYITIRGCAFQRKGSVVCISAPGYNGKSSFLLQTLTEEGQYIAEDNLVVNLKWKEVYPTANAKMGKIYGRDANENLERTLDVESIVNTKRKIDEFYLVQNTTWPHQPYPKTMKDYIFMNSLYFLNNLFIRTYLCEERLSQTFHNMVEEYSKFSDYKFVQIKNYEYSQIFNGH